MCKLNLVEAIKSSSVQVFLKGALSGLRQFLANESSSKKFVLFASMKVLQKW